MEKKLSHRFQTKWIRIGVILTGALALTCVVSLGFVLTADGVLTTIAGTGERGFSGDGGPAIQARLAGPGGLALAADGTLYVTDTFNNRIRKIDPSGIITTIAGTGELLYNGDNKLATQANLNAPRGIALDASGKNLYIADNGNHLIRKVDLTTGLITTVAGRPLEPEFDGDGGLAVQAKLNNPAYVAVDAGGNLFIADTSNNRIRRVDGATRIITTIAGTGAQNSSGDGGPARLAGLENPVSVTIGPAGDLFVADHNRVRRIDTNGNIFTVAGNGSFNVFGADQLGDGGPATAAIVRFAFDVAFDRAGNMYIAETLSHRIRRVDTSGVITTVVGSGDPRQGGFRDGPALQAQLDRPSAVVVDSAGNIYIADSNNFRVRKFKPE